jgi:hypothetical protein
LSASTPPAPPVVDIIKVSSASTWLFHTLR